MSIKNILIFASSIFFIGCVNSDGSSPYTYSSCSIVSSGAILAQHRADDISQCWDGVNYKEKSLALDWCRKNVAEYMGEKYIFGHSTEYKVASTNCPEK